MNCIWPKTDLEILYHNTEWCIPKHEDKIIFEFLVLEMMQAGLSWGIILNKRAGMKEAFSDFNFEEIARYTEQDMELLLQNKKIIRNRLKINALVNNARKFIEIRKEFGSFDRYIWSFVDNITVKNSFRSEHEIPIRTTISDCISKDLKKRGFKFVGSVICYSFMQALGMTNDHLITCEYYHSN